MFGREAAKFMKVRRQGCIFFTGATASVRGNPGYTAFGSAKAALRSVAQTMAKEVWAHSIHVAHFVIDGGIDSSVLLLLIA